jgi:hypothetical protein
MSIVAFAVRKPCQPPAFGGSFFARLVTSVYQSIDCMSTTLKPAFPSGFLRLVQGSSAQSSPLTELARSAFRHSTLL